MKQLSGIDASFLYMESDKTPMHVAGCVIFEYPENLEGSFYDHFLTFFKSRVHLVPMFSEKLARTVFQMDHPGWVDAGELDYSYHIREEKLAKPGTYEQLETHIAKLHSERLDRKKPLWQLTVIEGLEDGKVALYSKLHHAAIDGGAGMVIAQALYDLTPQPREVKPPKPKEEKRKPNMTERAILNLHDLASNAVRQQLTVMENIPKVMNQWADMIEPVVTGKLGLPQLIAPKTPFNVALEKGRTYAMRSISLQDVKAISKATETKVNDVVMAICSGCLRAYLDEKHQLPSAALVSFVPISLREAGNQEINNQVFGMNVPLATNYRDPVKRLQKIKDESGVSKTMAGGVKEFAPQDFTLLGAPLLLPGLMQFYGDSKLANALPQAVNLTISNTMGPPFPLYCAGAKIHAIFPVSIPTHGIGLNITVQSYLDKMNIGITAAENTVPDMAHMGDLFVKAFEELRDTVLGKPKKKPAPRTRKSTS